MSVILRKRALPSGNIQLYLDICSGGKEWIETLGLVLIGDRLQDRETKKRAEVIRTKRQREMDEGRLGISLGDKRKKSFVSYYEELIDTKNSANTKASWRDALTHFQNFAGDTVTFGALTRETLEKFKQYLLKLETVAPNSAQIYFSRIKTAITQAVKDGIIPVNPATYITIRKEHKLPAYLTLDEVRKLAATRCANNQVKAAFLFGCFTGLRCSDLVALTWDKIDGDYIDFRQQKTGTSERLPLSAQAKELLRTQKDAYPSPRVTTERAANTVFFLPRQSTIDKQLKAWAKAAEIKKSVSMHKARHTFATLSLASGIDIYTTSKLLGHKNLATTQIYAQVIDEKKKRAVDMLPRI